jgi:hypothetical protein
MTGALLATIGATAVGGGAGAPDAMAWGNIYAEIAGGTNILTVAGLAGAKATLTATITGGGELAFNLNGKITTYTGGFVVSDGDTLGWMVFAGGGGPSSGTVTVKSAGGTVTVGTFTYVLKSIDLGIL